MSPNREYRRFQKVEFHLLLDTIIPENPNLPYDMKELILSIADQYDFFELQENYAKNISNWFY